MTIFHISIKEMISKGRERYFKPDRRINATEEEILGIILAEYIQWDSSRLKSLIDELLQSSNMKTVSDKFDTLWKEFEESSDEFSKNLTKNITDV